MTDTQDQSSSLDGGGTITNALAEDNHFDLDYPQIPLDLSLESLLAHSGHHLSCERPNHAGLRSEFVLSQ